LPYDRPKLSKAMSITVDKIQFRDEEFYKRNDIELMLSTEVTELNPQAKSVTLSNGESIKYDAALVSTGGLPQDLAFIKGAKSENIFTLRDVDDAHNIIKAIEGQHVVIIGSSFIGMETASCIVSKAKTVTVVGMEKVPFERVLGPQIGLVMQQFHESKGVKFQMEDVCAEFKATDGKVSSVLLKSGKEFECGVAIIGAGIKPNTGFIKESDIVKKERDQSFIVDQYLRVCDGLYAAGDIARFPLPLLNNKLVRIEHWGMSQIQGRIAALNMLGKQVPCTNVPVFWTVQYGKSIRYCGHALEYDEVIFDKAPDGLEKQTFVAYYAKDDKILAVCSINRDPVVADCAQLMKFGKMPTVAQIKQGIAKDGNSENILKAKL